MEMQLASERNVSRKAVNVECQVVREGAFTLLGTRGVDLSPEGMLVVCDTHAEVGEEVIVTFRIPGTQHWIDTLATVARVIHGQRRTDRFPAIGLRFAPLDTESNLLIRCALRRFPPPFPARSLRVDYAATAAMIALS